MINFQDLTFRYTAETPRIVENLNLHIDGGKVTVILGPNGCGKTTLLHLMLGWHHAEAGRISIAGRPIEEYHSRERGRLMSLVPQSEYIPFEYSIIEYVLLGRLPYLHPLEIPTGTHVELAKEAIRTVGLDPADTRPITILSGGERQLLLLARSLCQKPKLLILDEPTSHLDLANKKRINEILQRLRGGGMTVVLTTHEPDFALAAGDDLVLMGTNGLIAAGELDKVFTAENLGKTYQTGIDTETTADGRKAVFWW